MTSLKCEGHSGNAGDLPCSGPGPILPVDAEQSLGGNVFSLGHFDSKFDPWKGLSGEMIE